MTAETLPLIQTKLYRPPVQAGYVPRPRLLELLHARWQERPLTLISAPAGYGKSVLASMWLEKCDCPTGWVSLDEGDNDLSTFVGYLLAALKMAFPDLSLETQMLLEAPSVLSAKWLAQYLLNELAQITTNFIIALDDIHLIQEQSIFEFLAEMLRFPAPAMHLVLIGRQDPPLPVSSLRAYRRVTEVRLIHLRFSTEETTALFAQMLQRKIDESHAAAWTKRTEGWPVALYLAALSLRIRGQTAEQDASIGSDSRYLNDYLLAEVLGALTPARQTWLLKTSLLDRFCAPLCEAVCQEEGESLTGQAYMSWLQTSNLFLIPLDDQDEWFRFHHLFQDHLQNLLKGQLIPGEMATLHQQASRWFERNGWTDEAIQHALAAEDIPAALRLVSQHRHTLMNKDQWHRIQRWLEWFPIEVASSDPMLSLTQAHLDIVRGRPNELFSYLERVQSGAASGPGDSGLATELAGELASLSAFADGMLGKASSAIEKAVESLRLLPLQAVHVRTMSLGSLGFGYQMSGRIGQDAAIFKDALANPEWSSDARAKLLVLRSMAYFMEGDLAGTQLLAGESLQLVTRNNLTATPSFARYFSGIVHYLRNELAQAESILLTLTNDMEFASPGPLTYAACALASIYNARQQPDKAGKLLQQVSEHFDTTGDSVATASLGAFQVELSLAQDDLDRARYLDQFANYEPRPPTWFHHIPQLTPIKLLLARRTATDLENALKALEKFDRQMLTFRRNTVRIEVLALQALTHDARGDRQMASEVLRSSLRLAEPGGFIRNFVDLGPPMADLLARLHEQADTGMDAYISRILAAFQVHERDTPAPDMKKPLTKRELQTLRLLAADLSPHDIASEMTISLTTTRTHIRNVYQKLGVHSRFEAVQRAEELSLI